MKGFLGFGIIFVVAIRTVLKLEESGEIGARMSITPGCCQISKNSGEV